MIYAENPVIVKRFFSARQCTVPTLLSWYVAGGNGFSFAGDTMKAWEQRFPIPFFRDQRQPSGYSYQEWRLPYQLRKAMILKSLKTHALMHTRERIVEDVRIGTSYTAVKLNDCSTGVAMTFLPEGGKRCASTKPALAGRLASELIEQADADDLLARTVAMATINAILNHERENLVPGDTIELLKPANDDIVGMVGYFGPLVPKLRATVQKLHIFEQAPVKGDDLYPPEKALEILPSCSLAIVTSTSLLNHTFESIARSVGNCRMVAMVGATTPLAPTVLADYGIDLLSGIVIRDPRSVLRIVSEAGGMKAFKGYIDKVNLVCKGNMETLSVAAGQRSGQEEKTEQ